MSKLDFLRALAKPLLSLSSSYEPFVPGFRPTLAESMSIFAGLEKITEQHMPSTRVSVETSTPAAPQVRRPEVIEALLALRARRVAEAGETSSAPVMAPDKPRFSGVDFLMEDLPEVRVVPKAGSTFRSSHAATHSILRSVPGDETT